MAQKGKEPLVIYLDQNCWIGLARLYFGKEEKGEQGKVLLNKIETAVKENKALFPITLTNYDEALRRNNIESRKRLAYFMFKISQGYSFQPDVKKTIRMEMSNLIFKKLNRPTVDIRNAILEHGASNLVGAKATITSKNGGKPVPEEVKAQLLTLAESTWALNYLLNISPTKENYVTQEEIDIMERSRKDLLLKYKDNDLRYRFYFAQSILELLLPELAKISYDLNLPHDFIIKRDMTRKDMDEFLEAIPTALCLFTLSFYRDQLYDRPIQANDFNDIWFLSLAIPYSDIVITERMWTGICENSKLCEKCNTKVFSSVYKLLDYF
jgi:hypothetical protein